MGAALVAFGVVFLAELGDKTQLVVLTHGARHRPAALLASLAVAIAVLQAISVAAGGAVGEALPERATSLVVGALFCGFAIWTWRGATAQDDEGAASSGGSVWGVSVVFFLAELGDKTMITTASLAADRGIVSVYVGSFAAMMASAALALAAGGWINRRVSAATIARAGAVAFAVVGVVTLASALSS